jgi:hypothetical protein
MNRHGIMNFLSLNRSVTDLGGEVQQFRLPRVNPFPKLNQGIVQSKNGGGMPVLSRAMKRGAVIIEDDLGPLPEMTTDVIDISAGHAVGNIKRERSEANRWSRSVIGHWFGRMWGNHRAARLQGGNLR